MNLTQEWTSWIYSYLNDRKFYVKVHKTISKSPSMTSDVPQGSNIGPILFLLFINNLPTVIKHARILMLADDCKMFYALNKPNDVFELQTDLNSLSIWAISNHLFF